MLDESLLDDPEKLSRADTRGLLHGAAASGARVRTAARSATEAGVADLRPEGRPRALFVAGSGPDTGSVADLLSAVIGNNVPVSTIPPTGALAAPGALLWSLPGWAGPLDLLFVVTADGTEPGLTGLVDQAYHRGCAIVAVAPGGAPIAEEVRSRHGLVIPLAPVLYDEAPEDEGPYGESEHPGLVWGLLTPLLAVADRMGLVSAPPDVLHRVADRLDRVAERCGPAIATYSNSAKTLAVELADALPLLWSEGRGANAVARRFAHVLASVAGRPALAAALPEALMLHNTLLSGAFAAAADPDDFFRDRVEESEALHARVVLLCDGSPGERSAAPAARDLALSHDTPVSELEADDGGPLEAVAELLAVADFTAVYLRLASRERP